MDFELPQDVKELRDAAREFAERELEPRARQADEEETFVHEQVAACAEAGWMGMAIPEAYGGSELSTLATSVVLEEMARACASTAVTLSVHGSLCSTGVLRFGTDDQK